MLPLSCQGAALAHLDSFPSDDLIWTDGSVHLSFGKGGFAAFPFQQAQFVQIFPLKPAPFCKVFAGLGSTNKSAISLLSDSRPPFRLFFYLKLSGKNCLISSPLLTDCNGSPDNRFSPETPRLISWPDRERYFCPLQFLGSLLPHLSTGCVLSHLNSLTYRFR